MQPQNSINAPQTGFAAEHRSRPNSLSDDHSELVPLLPIPNRTVKRLCADDSVDSHVKVGHRQTPYKYALYNEGVII